jgi:hypothetical protein
MYFDNLTEENILLYAAKCYDKPQCITSEFDEDYKRIRYIKRILQKYRKNRELKERLLLNHLVILQNVFGIEASTRMLFFRIESKDYPALKTILLYTYAMPDVVYGIRGGNIVSSDIPVDQVLVKKLRSL